MMNEKEIIEYVILEAFREKISEAIELEQDEVSFKAKIPHILNVYSDIYRAYQKGLKDGREEKQSQDELIKALCDERLYHCGLD